MIRALLGKEWIKARWPFLLAVAVSAVTLGNLWLTVRESFEFNDANALWNSVVHRKLIFYSGIRWNALVAGILLALAQFVPEVRKRRLRLLFHLPVDNHRALMVMMAAGLLGTLLVTGLNLLGLIGVVGAYYPADVTLSAVLTALPWFVAGLLAYSGTALVVLEPAWWRRVAFAALSFALASICYLGATYEAFAPSIGRLALLAALLPATVFLPAFRFKRGMR
jgi:hypothetical protein